MLKRNATPSAKYAITRTSSLVGLAHLVRELEHDSAALLAVMLEGPPTAGRIDRDGTQQVAQLPSTRRIEGAIGAVGQPCNFLERLCGDRLAALVEDEAGHPHETELASELAEHVHALLHAVAHEDHGVDLAPLRFGN